MSDNDRSDTENTHPNNLEAATRAGGKKKTTTTKKSRRVAEEEEEEVVVEEEDKRAPPTKRSRKRVRCPRLNNEDTVWWCYPDVIRTWSEAVRWRAWNAHGCTVGHLLRECFYQDDEWKWKKYFRNDLSYDIAPGLLQVRRAVPPPTTAPVRTPRTPSSRSDASLANTGRPADRSLSVGAERTTSPVKNSGDEVERTTTTGNNPPHCGERRCSQRRPPDSDDDCDLATLVAREAHEKAKKEAFDGSCKVKPLASSVPHEPRVVCVPSRCAAASFCVADAVVVCGRPRSAQSRPPSCVPLCETSTAKSSRPSSTTSRTSSRPTLAERLFFFDISEHADGQRRGSVSS